MRVFFIQRLMSTLKRRMIRFNDLTNISRLWAKGFKVYETFSVKFERQELVSPVYHTHTLDVLTINLSQ